MVDEPAALSVPKTDWRHGLTIRQQRFVQEFLVDLNATQAVLRAGYRVCTTKSARVIAAQTKRKPLVAAAIDRLLAEQAGITRTRIIEELALIAFANAGDFFAWGPSGVTVKNSADLTPEQRAVVAEVSETTTEAGGTIRVKLHNKLEALEKLAKATGLYSGHERAADEQAAKARRVPLENPFNTDMQLIQRDWLPSEYHGRAQIAPEMTYEDAVAALQTIDRDAADKPHATQIIKKALREQGYDGITHIGGGRFIGTNSARHRVIVAFDPNQVRSITAEFDETRTGEPDLMFAANGWRGYGLNPDFVTEGEAVFAEVEAQIARMAPGVKVRFEDLPPGVEGAHSRSLAAIFIALRANDPRAIGDHEVIHAARAMNLIDAAEWRTLKQAALEDDWIGKHGVGETYERVMIASPGCSTPSMTTSSTSASPMA